jgi:hypothetical protein
MVDYIFDVQWIYTQLNTYANLDSTSVSNPKHDKHADVPGNLNNGYGFVATPILINVDSGLS